MHKNIEFSSYISKKNL